ncbi:M1 family metallopeptidase [Streptomyces sp. SID14478]|uniref:M1 family metallopeptidase n=1 Tax=Streptomyces sp. SID14478 TaxID=2706073 RepID=UPI0013DF9FF2|nr:M1 family metallopeptidase [Streptomyces sp. SID14478]NEB81842.1 M1 family metallopeptidase [Streptomyces sp. SID14478]
MALAAVPACSGGVHGGPGAAGLRDPYFPGLGNGGYDVTHYALDLAYDPATHRLTGTADLTATARQSLSAFHLDLQGLTVDEVTVDGKRAVGSRAGHELTVRPHDELPDGSTFRTTVRYSGEPETITDPDGSEEGWLRTADGALGLGEPTGSMAWFPGNNHPSDKATYDITVTVPKGQQAVSNGELTSERTSADGRRTTYSWHVAQPMGSYLATVAVGRFDIRRSKTPSGLPVWTAVDPQEAQASKEVLGRLPEVITWETKRFGAYPFSSTGAIVDRDGDAGYALETQNRPVFPGAPDLGTLVHELAHQWYGDSVTPKSWRDMWLNEGFATYAEWLWEEDHHGEPAREAFDAVYARPKGAAVWSFPPADPPGAAQISDTPVYQRGAMVLQKVRETIGDADFFSLLKSWPADHKYGNADTGDFTAYVEKKNPGKAKALAGVWDVWLYGDGKPRQS